MPVYLRACSRCEGTKARENRADRKGRKKCPACYYQAVAPPSVGRRSLGTFRTKEEAEAALRRALTDYERGIDLAPRRTTIAQIAERFFKATKPDLAPATFARYEELWKLHLEPTLGAMLAANLKPAHIEELYAKLRTESVVYRHRSRAKATKGEERERKGKPLSANSVLRIHRFLHRLLGWAERLNLVARNVVRSVEAPKATASPAQALSIPQIVQLLKAAEGMRLRPFFVMAAMTGMRRGEIGALTWGAVDLEKGELRVRQAIGEDRRGGTFVKSTKSGRERVIPLNSHAIGALRSHRTAQAWEKRTSHGAYNDQGLVFADQVGGVLDLDMVSKAFTKLARSIGIKARGVSLHSLRHCAATMALRSGVDVRTVSALLGHASPSTTLNVYGHVVAGAQEAAVTAIADALNQAQAKAIGGEAS